MLSESAKPPVLWVLFLGLLGYSWIASHDHDQFSQPGESSIRLVPSGEESGLVFRHRPPHLDPRLDRILPQVAGTGAAVSAVDVNGDGLMDLYTVTSRGGEPNGLFIGNGDGTFVERAEEAGIANLNVRGEGVSHGSLWGDLDGDHDPDLVVYMWGKSRVFRNDSSAQELRFVEIPDAGLPSWMNASTGCLLDFDRDGDLDLFLGGYYREDTDLWKLSSTRIMHEDQEFAQNGGRNVLLRNDGSGRFLDVSESHGIGGRRWTYAVVAADLDEDGWQDLYVANDYGTEEFFRNLEGEGFELVGGLGLDSKSKSGMCVALGDVSNRDELALYITNISESRYLMQGNNLRLVQLGSGGGFENVASGATANCGWAWGADFGDLDLDGWCDLVVVNGFHSANPERNYWYQMSKLATGTGTLIEDADNWPAFEDMSLSGYQSTRVLRHRGRGFAFREIGQASGISDTFDGRAVVLVDIDNDGRLDMVTANQDGPLTLYRNESQPGRWIGLALRGSVSNWGGIGARVSAHYGPHIQTQVVTAGSGFCAQTDPRVHFGLGQEPLERIEIRWPSGQLQVLEDLPLGSYQTVQEPDGPGQSR